ISTAIVDQDDRWRQFVPFGLVWAGGALGRPLTQAVYWGMQFGDKFDESKSRFREWRARRAAAAEAARKLAEEKKAAEAAERKKVEDAERRKREQEELKKLLALEEQEEKRREEEAAGDSAPAGKD